MIATNGGKMAETYMFGTTGKAEKKAPQDVKQKAKKQAPSIISSGLHVVGNLTSDGEVHIDGVVNGDILADELTVGEGARITGHIEADVALIRGQVNGIIRARSVTLSKTACVIGDIVHEDLSIETGAQMEGHCRRRSKEEAQAVVNRPASPQQKAPEKPAAKPQTTAAVAAQ